MNGIPERFVKDNNSIIYKIGFDFKERTHFQNSSPLIIIFTEVEDIIIEIGEPNYNYSLIKSMIYLQFAEHFQIHIIKNLTK